MEMTRDELFAKAATLYARGDEWFQGLRLTARTAALIGAAAGALAGLVMVRSMWRHAVFTGPHQNLTAGAALIALWLCIGVIAGLTVLAPAYSERDAADEALDPSDASARD